MLLESCIDPCFFFNDTATTEIYTLSLHDALPILPQQTTVPTAEIHPAAERQTRSAADKLRILQEYDAYPVGAPERGALLDRKSTRLNSSHANISYAVFCLKKKKI